MWVLVSSHLRDSDEMYNIINSNLDEMYNMIVYCIKMCFLELNKRDVSSILQLVLLKTEKYNGWHVTTITHRVFFAK